MTTWKHLLSQLLTALLLSCTVTANADTLTIHEVFAMAEQHFPLLQKDMLYDRTLQLRRESLQSNLLPEIRAVGSAIYQSDVVEFPFEIPGTDPLDLPHERLQVYVDISQAIYEGGVTHLQQELERHETEINKQQADVSLQQIREQVLRMCFAIIVAGRSEDIVLNAVDLLREKLEISRTAVEGGIADSSQLLKLEAEIVSREQQIAEIRQQARSMIDILSVLTGRQISYDVAFVVPEELNIAPNVDPVRPELMLLDLRQKKLRTAIELQDALYQPKVSAFGQGGIGYPNPYNFFDDTFSPFFMVGVRASWKIWDWGKREREKELLLLQSEMFEAEKENVQQNVDMELQKYLSRIEELDQVIENDLKLIQLRDKIHEVTAVQFDRGIINALDYIESVNQLQTVQLNLELHEAQRLLAKALYLNEKGVFFTTVNND